MKNTLTCLTFLLILMIPYMHLYLKAFDKELQVWISARSPITNTVAFLTFEIIAHPSFLLTLLYYQHICYQ